MCIVSIAMSCCRWDSQKNEYVTTMSVNVKQPIPRSWARVYIALGPYDEKRHRSLCVNTMPSDLLDPCGSTGSDYGNYYNPNGEDFKLFQTSCFNYYRDGEQGWHVCCTHDA